MLAITRRTDEAVHVSLNTEAVFNEFCKRRGLKITEVSLADFLSYQEQLAFNFTVRKKGNKIVVGFNDPDKRFNIAREEIVAPAERIPIPRTY